MGKVTQNDSDNSAISMGDHCYWWERSVDPRPGKAFLVVSSAGNPWYRNPAADPVNVLPAFCF